MVLIGTVTDEVMIPVVRAQLAKRLSKNGIRVTKISTVLKVSSAAVVQYLNGKRGKALSDPNKSAPVIDALADKLLNKLRAGLTAEVNMMELLEAAQAIRIANVGEKMTSKIAAKSVQRSDRVMEILRGRLQLELKASEKCLQYATDLEDDYAKLLLRMIASDSIRHADVVSQIMSWLEVGERPSRAPPRRDVLDSLLRIEDSAEEVSLSKVIPIAHPVARLLLEWIDADERKHERIINKMIRLWKS